MAAKKGKVASVAVVRYAAAPVAPRIQPIVIRTQGTGRSIARRAGRAAARYGSSVLSPPRIMRAAGLAAGAAASNAVAGYLATSAGLPPPLASGLVAIGGYLLGGSRGAMGSFADGMLAAQGGNLATAAVGYVGTKFKST